LYVPVLTKDLNLRIFGTSTDNKITLIIDLLKISFVDASVNSTFSD